jgi:hypothetical protein
MHPPAGVLADQHRRDVHVVLRVPDHHPAAAAEVPATGDPGAVHQVGRDLGPLRVRQHPVAWRVAQ